jgi:hypothetical protein
MAKLLAQVDLRDVAYTGIAAGLIFMGFEMIATTLVTGSAAPMPFRLIAGIVPGRTALDPRCPLFVAGMIGFVVHLVLSIAFAAIFGETVTRIEQATEGELMSSGSQLALAGTVFGTALWLVNFYVVAPLAGWTWFPENAHHIV